MIRRSASVYAAALDRAWTEAAIKDRPAIIGHFLQLVIRQRASKIIPRVVERLQALDLKRRKTQAVSIQVATKSAGATVVSELEKTLGKIEVTVHENPGVIGGVAVRLGDTLIDGTVATQLQRLHTKLIS